MNQQPHEFLACLGVLAFGVVAAVLTLILWGLYLLAVYLLSLP